MKHVARMTLYLHFDGAKNELEPPIGPDYTILNFTTMLRII
jgi:hypothetical protein